MSSAGGGGKMKEISMKNIGVTNHEPNNQKREFIKQQYRPYIPFITPLLPSHIDTYITMRNK